jgi:hypothetical protein
VENHTKKGAKGQRKGPRFWVFFARFSGCFRGLPVLLELLAQEGQKMTFRSLVLGMLAVMFTTSAHATPLPRYGLFVFSSLCTDYMISDLNGDRLVLVRLPFHDFGYMEGGDGGFVSAPLQNLKIDDRNGGISFRYRDEDSDKIKTVASTVTAENVGLISSDGKPFRLPRLWKADGETPVCPRN